MDDFLLRALAAGLGVALVTGPLGCFVVWRRQAYFGAALAHAALPGVALGILLDLNAAVGVAVVCLLVALLAAALEGQRRLASDTLLGIMAHGALALGLVAVALIEGMRVDLLGYLFGDILAVSWSDVAWIAAGGGLANAGRSRHSRRHCPGLRDPGGSHTRSLSGRGHDRRRWNSGPLPGRDRLSGAAGAEPAGPFRQVPGPARFW